jgi:hypothetical protein
MSLHHLSLFPKENQHPGGAGAAQYLSFFNPRFNAAKRYLHQSPLESMAIEGPGSIDSKNLNE